MMRTKARLHTLYTKLRVIYIPFLGISTAFIIVYSVLDAFFVIKWEVLPLSESVSDFWLPWLLPWIPVLLVLRPRLKALRVTGRNRYGFLFIASFAMAAPTIVAQEYLLTATGRMTRLARISDLELVEPTKYYSVGKMFAEKSLRGSAGSVERVGRNEESLKISFFFACPLQDGAGDTAPADRRIWIGMKAFEIIGSKITKLRLADEYDKYFNTCTVLFGALNLGDFSYFERITRNDDQRLYVAAVQNSTRYQGAREPVILIGHDEPFESRNGSKFVWIFGAFAIGAAVFLVILLFPSLDEKEVHRILSGRRAKTPGPREWLGYFYPRPGLFVTPILMDINIAVFCAMVFSGLGVTAFQTADLLHWGADYGPFVVNGEAWRLVTSMFLHGGLMHLAGNMYGLMFAGVFLERLVPRFFYVLTYFVTGLCASMASISLNPSAVSVGASGAIFGLYGLLLFLLLKKDRRVKFARNPIFFSIVIFVGFNLFSGMTTEGVDNAAHVAGLISGIALGAVYRITPFSAMKGNVARRSSGTSAGESLIP